jgi:hypothetical protein
MQFSRIAAAFLLLLPIALANAQDVNEQSVTEIGPASFTTASQFSLDRSAIAGQASDWTSFPGIVMPKPDLVSARKEGSQRSSGFARSAEDVLAPAASAGLVNPDPTPKTVVGTRPNFSGFAGLTGLDNQNAGSVFNFEPPDQGLAVGGGFVFEAVNLVFAIYDTSGNRFAGPVLANAFFGLAPFFNPGTGLFGPRLSDPKVYYDQALQRWFLTILEEDLNPTSGAASGRTHVYIAVSTGNLPIDFRVFSIDTTDDGTLGTPAHPDCPCLPDQPLIGADKNGFYISTNEFPLFKNGFNGAQIYALSKNFLALGALPTIVHFSALPLAESIAYSVQPAISLGFNGEPARGLEYFLSALDFDGTLDNRIAVWAVTNTVSLTDLHPNVKLSKQVITSEVYGQPPPAVQKPGPFPLGMSLGKNLPLIDTNDDRMNQVVFEDGNLWSGVNTIVGGIGTNPDGSPNFARAGIAYFVVAPSVDSSGAVSATIASQDYVAAPGLDSVMYPSIGVTRSGKAAMTFTLVGPTPSGIFFTAFYPSMAFTRLNLTSGAGNIQLGAAGLNPDDGFSGYPARGPGPGVGRWGDYSAAVADTDGSIWMAAEWIPDTPRSRIVNWGTFIGKIQ